MPIRKIKSAKNSHCAVRLETLDWSDWFTDNSFSQTYLHVAGEDESYQRVYCKGVANPRIKMKGGELYWLI